MRAAGRAAHPAPFRVMAEFVGKRAFEDEYFLAAWMAVPRKPRAGGAAQEHDPIIMPHPPRASFALEAHFGAGHRFAEPLLVAVETVEAGPVAIGEASLARAG